MLETSALIFTVTYRSVRVDLWDRKSLGSVALDKELDANDMNVMLYAVKGRGWNRFGTNRRSWFLFAVLEVENLGRLG